MLLPAILIPEMDQKQSGFTDLPVQRHPACDLCFCKRSGRPAYGSLLIFGRDPQQRIPGAYLQFLRIDGDHMGDPIKDEKMLSGPLPEIMDRVDQLLEVHIQVSVDIESALSMP